jgi:hypothetical protein
MQSCYITGSYYVRNAVKHMYHNGLDETFLYHEKNVSNHLKHQILQILFIKNICDDNHKGIVLRVHLCN